MLEFLKTASPELIPIDEDPDVVAARTPLAEARARLATLEEEEKRLIRLVTTGRVHHAKGRVTIARDEDIEDARRRLSILKGTQTGWHLPEVHALREDIHALNGTYQAAISAAKARVTDAGDAQLKPLVQQLADILIEAMALSEQVEELCQRIGDAGVEKIQHPFPSLMPHQIVAWQLDLAKKRGLVD